MARWLIDFDSTLAALDDAQIKSCNEKFGTSYTVDNISDWSWWFDAVPTQYADYVWGRDCFLSPQWTAKLEPVQHALAVVKTLRALGEEIFVVSDRQPQMEEWLRNWLAAHWLTDVRVILSNRETRPKWEVADHYQLRFAVDDAPHNATGLSERSDRIERVYLYNRPYNQNVETVGTKIVRVMSWPEILEHQIDTLGRFNYLEAA